MPTTRTSTAHGNIRKLLRYHGGLNVHGPKFALRIANIASGAETVHTTLDFASPLAYANHDSTTVSVYGNVVHATNGQTTGEVLGNGDATKQAFPNI